MVTHIASSKATSSIVGAGLIASIAQNPNFWILCATAVIVSAMAYTYDLNDEDNHRITSGSIAQLFKYIFSGLGVIFLTFYGLVFWVPEELQLPHIVWYMVSMVAAGYATNIIKWVSEAFPAIFPKLFGKL